jgi:hypothetical protein
MTTFEWAMVSISAGGFLLTAAGVLGSCVWGIGKIKAGVDGNITDERIRIDTIFEAERENHARALKEFAAQYSEQQIVQDRVVGEMGAALRQYIANVEKEMHQIEIWGRDNFVHKGAFEKVTDRIEGAIKDMAASIKSDFRHLNEKIDQKN